MTKIKAARNSCNYSTPTKPIRPGALIIARDILMGTAFAVALVGIPAIMSALKCAGVW